MKIHMKKGMKEIKEKNHSSESQSELQTFKKLEKQVLNEINANQINLNKGIIIFAAQEPELWSVHDVQVRIKTNFDWGIKPEIDQLFYINKAYPHAVIICTSLNDLLITVNDLCYDIR